MFNSLGHLELFMYEILVHANDLVIVIKLLQPRSNSTTKEKSDPNRLDQVTGQNIAET